MRINRMTLWPNGQECGGSRGFDLRGAPFPKSCFPCDAIQCARARLAQALRPNARRGEFREHFAIGPAGNQHAIGFLHAVARMREPVGQLAVVGDEDQSFAVQIQPADGEEADVGRRNKSITRGRPDGSLLVETDPGGLFTA